MARYEHVATNPRFLPVDLAQPLIPGTFEHAVHRPPIGGALSATFDACSLTTTPAPANRRCGSPSSSALPTTARIGAGDDKWR
jgi:hypothetical protein